MAAMDFLAPSALHDMLPSRDVLVIDTRPTIRFNECRVAGAHSLCLPAILWRRFLKQVDRPGALDEFLLSCDPALRSRKTATLIVLYDEHSSANTCVDPKSPLATLATYFAHEGIKVCCLDGGFAALSAAYPALTAIAAPASSPTPSTSAAAAEHPASPRSTRKRHFISTEFSFIHGFLAVGSEEMANDFASLLSEGVTHVLNLTASECSESVKKNLQCLRIEMQDTLTQNILAHLKPAFEFIETCRRAGGKILVHCMAGVSRSVAVAAAYLIWRERMTMQRALTLIQVHRPDACPNINFVGQLLALDKEITDAQPPCTPRTPTSVSALACSQSWAPRTPVTPCTAT
eukprot:m.241781 g.241781  ORF g.241781 m.241781 type:complete len:347 (+) comp13920_c0_seq1:130-1170(+)